MRRRLISGFFAFLCATGVSNRISPSPLYGQEAGEENFDAAKYKAMSISIIARVTDKSKPELPWKSETSKLTIPGRPVSMKLVGTNIIVLVLLTPYLTESDALVLVAQGQVWIAGDGRGLDYRTSLKTIPAAFGEKLFFFPLGLSQGDSSAKIEMEIMVDLYKEPPKNEGQIPDPSLDQAKKGEIPQPPEPKK